MVTLKELRPEELFLPGNASCPGCMLSLVIRMALKVLGPNTVMTVPACCSAVIQGYYPRSSSMIPTLNTAFAAAAATASGISAALELSGRGETSVVAWAGDGGTADIGIQGLSGAAERGENFIYVCYDNEAYMNTGTQSSSATPTGAATTTAIRGKAEPKKDVPAIMVAHGVPYVATACAAFPLDFADKIKKAMSIRGLKYIHILTPCPPGWRYPTERGVDVGRMAVMTGSWILYEWQGGKHTLTGPSRGLLDRSRRRPLAEYLRMQGRFGQLGEAEVARLQGELDAKWAEMARRLDGGAGRGVAGPGE